jgi:hypothetical protein
MEARSDDMLGADGDDASPTQRVRAGGPSLIDNVRLPQPQAPSSPLGEDVGVLCGKPLFNVTRPMQHYTIKAYEPSGLTVRHERNHKQWLGIESRA